MLNQEEIKRAFDQAMDIWIKPEIENRKKKGWLKDSFELKRAQVIFTPGQKAKIKFNEDIEIIAKSRLNRSVIKGEEIKVSDINSVEEFIVDCPPNSGHITIFRFLDSWIFIFSARYNKKKIKDFTVASREFYESAKDNLEKKRLRPFFEDCWASAELSSACHFLSLGQEYSAHRGNLEKFKNWAELGNVKKQYSDMLYKLNDLRKSARYMHTDEFKKEKPKIFLEVIEKMLDEANRLSQ
jgi:uncharacterized protein (UPF0332 family)